MYWGIVSPPGRVRAGAVRRPLTLTSNDAGANRHYLQTSCPGCRSTASRRAARTQGLGGGATGAGGGAVSRRKRSTAATTAAASSGEADGATISSFGRRLGTRRDDASRAAGGYRSGHADGARQAPPARRVPPVGVHGLARGRRRARRGGPDGP